MSVSLDGRDINELRVVDLKAELEKRGLDKSGNKQTLLERLQKSIQEDKEDSTELDIKEEKLNEALSPKKEMNTDVLDLNSSLGESEKDVKMEATTELKAAIKDNDSNEDSGDADTDFKSSNKTEEVHDVKNGSAPISTNGDTDGDGDVFLDLPEDLVKEELDKSDILVKQEDFKDVKAEEQDEDVVGDCDMDMKTEENNIKEEENGQEETTNGTAHDEEKKSTPATAAAKDGKKESDGGQEKSSMSPSKIKERLVNDQNRNLWITNISQTTRATELKQALSEHGKVVGAKVVINARHPAACCYGYVRMETVADADNCIAKLNNTELNGQIIRIEKVRPDHLNPNSKTKPETPVKEKPSQKTPVRAPTPTKEEAKRERKPVEAPPKDEKKDKPKSDDRSTDRKTSTSSIGSSLASKTDKDSKDISKESKDKARGRSSRDKERDNGKGRSKDRSDYKMRSNSGQKFDHRPNPRYHNIPPPKREVPLVRKEKDILTFDKIKTERERERLREREREMRMRRREESERIKEIERRQRSEEVRLERERQKIKEERERLERERAELLVLERERQKREREKIEMERMELQRVKMRIQEEERRAVKRPAPSNFRERDDRNYDDRKRPVADRHFAEAPPPPRFDPPSSIKARDPSPQMKKFASNTSGTKDYKRLSYEKRDSYPPKRDYDERGAHSSTLSRNSGPVPKYEGNSSNYSRDRDMRAGSGPRNTGVRNSGSSGISNMTSSSKYTDRSDNKVRYNDRERDRSPHYNNRAVREDRVDRDRRPVSDSKSDLRGSRDNRYPEPKVDSVRYDRTSSSSGASWSQHKTFTPTNTPSNKPWNKDAWRSSDATPNSGDRWASNASSRPSLPFSNNPSLSSMGPSCPPPPGINTYVNDRFDYKSNMSSMRKY